MVSVAICYGSIIQLGNTLRELLIIALQVIPDSCTAGEGSEETL